MNRYAIQSALTPAIAMIALTGCLSSHEPGNQDHHGKAGSNSVSIMPGKLIYDRALGNTVKLRVFDSGEEAVITVEGHESEKGLAEVLIHRLDRVGSYAEIGELMGEAAVPKEALRNLDSQYQGFNLQAEAVPFEVDAVGGGAGIDGPLAKQADHADPTQDAEWDWEEDARWFKSLYSGNNLCSYNRSTYVNHLWAWTQTYSWEHKARAMAASHSFGAWFLVQEKSGSGWIRKGRWELQPRHFVSVRYSGNSRKTRRFDMDGYGPDEFKRIHLDVLTNKMPIGIECVQQSN